MLWYAGSGGAGVSVVAVLSLPAVLSASGLYGYLSEKNKAIPYMPNLGFCLGILVFLMFENGQSKKRSAMLCSPLIKEKS